MNRSAHQWTAAALTCAVLFVNTAHAGINTWTSHGPGRNRNVGALAIDPITPSTLYAATYPAGVFKSTDAGTSWIVANTGLPDSDLAPVNALAIDPLTPSTLYAGTDGGGVFKSTDAGGTWTAANSGLPLPFVTVLAIDSITPSTLYAVPIGGFAAAGVFKSMDAGATWVAASLGRPNARLWALAIDPITPSTLYAGAAGFFETASVFKSTDAGATWAAANAGLTDVDNVTSLAIDPITPTTLYAAAQEFGVFKSTDGGGSWAAVNAGLADASVSTLAIDPITPSTLYAGAMGVFKSTDAGATWAAASAGLTGAFVTTLAIDPMTPSRLYAGTADGVFAIQQVPVPDCAGDCNADGQVSIDELIIMVNIALGSAGISACRPGDTDSNGQITIDEIVVAVNHALQSCPLPADRVLLNGKVFTGDPAQPWAEAVAVHGERIVAVGASDELRGLADAANVIDLGGRTVIPGINDAHIHAPTLPRILWSDQGNEPTLDDRLTALADLAAFAPMQTWIGGTIGVTVLDDPAATAAALDAIAPHHFVWLEAFTGHGLLVNSPVLDLLGIADNEPDPLGGFFVRTPGSDTITGVVHEYAKFWIGNQVSRQPETATQVAFFRRVSQDARRFGITSIQLMNNDHSTADAARLLAAADPPVRWRIIRFPFPQGGGWPLDDISGINVQPHPRVRVSGLKWILDGTPIERLAALRAPYSDRPDLAGHVNFPAAVVREMLEQARAAGEQVVFHASGDRTIETILTEMEATADDATWRAARVRIEHGDLLLPDLIERAQRLGVIVVQNPTHFLTTETSADRWGADRLEHAMPLASLLRAGIPIALGSDVDGVLNPYEDIMYAVMHPTNPAEALTVEQAVAAHTSGVAFAEFAEHDKGRLLPGMLADLAVLSQDIFTVPVQQLGNTLSVFTLVGGRVAYCDAQHVAFCP